MLKVDKFSFLLIKNIIKKILGSSTHPHQLEEIKKDSDLENQLEPYEDVECQSLRPP
jgi:hypothetical protein